MPVTPCRPKWKSSMTDRERFNNQMHYKPVDRCFNMEFGWWEENFQQWDIFVKNGVTTNEEGDLFFNFDRIEKVSAKVWMHPVFTRETVEETPTTLIMRSEGGLLVEVPRMATTPSRISLALPSRRPTTGAREGRALPRGRPHPRPGRRGSQGEAPPYS